MGLFFDLEFCWDGAGLGSGSWSVVGSVFGACFRSGVGLENGVGIAVVWAWLGLVLEMVMGPGLGMGNEVLFGIGFAFGL